MAELPRIGAELAGYRLESLVSRGGMALVYLAEHLSLGRRVALKVLAEELADDDRFRERFLRESRLAAGIDHPNIVPIYDAGEAEGVLYLAMRYVEGTDLRGLLALEGPLDIERTASIAGQMGSALDAAHAHGLVHRDVKPGNALVVPRPIPQAPDHVYLADFGLAKRPDSGTRLTATGQFLGTVNYVAPEQIEGHDLDARTDVYALGCVLFECLTGAPPFQRDDDMAVLWAHIQDAAPRVTDRRGDVPSGIADVVARALEKAPDDRQASAGELVEEFERCARPASAPARSVAETAASPARTAGEAPLAAAPAAEDGAPAVPPQRPSPRRRNPVVLAAGALVVVAVVAAVAFVLLRGGDPEEESGSVYEEIVLPLVPGAIRETCREGERPADVRPGPGEATAACVANDGQIRVTYTRVSAAEPVERPFFRVAERELGEDLAAGTAPPPRGACRGEGEGWDFWHRPSGAGGAAHAEGPPPDSSGAPPSGGQVGRVACLRSGGRSVVVWTDPATQVFAWADSPGLPLSLLMTWWRTKSGPRNDQARSSGPGAGGGTGGG